MISPDKLLWYRERLNVTGEFLCRLTDDPAAVEAYSAVLYVQSSLALDAEEIEQEIRNPKDIHPK